MTTKSDNHNLNLLLTVVIAVLILFLVFKDKINLGSYYTEQGELQTDTNYVGPSSVQEKLKSYNSIEEQLEIEKVERLENDFLNNRTVANLRQELARLSSALEQITAKENLSREKVQQEKLLSEQLTLQLESERLNAQSLMEERATTEQTIAALNATLEQNQKDTQFMRRDAEKFSLSNNRLESELQLKKKEIIRSRLEVKRLTEELAKKDRVIATKNIEITRRKSELSRMKQQFAKTGISSTGS